MSWCVQRLPSSIFHSGSPETGNEGLTAHSYTDITCILHQDNFWNVFLVILLLSHGLVFWCFFFCCSFVFLCFGMVVEFWDCCFGFLCVCMCVHLFYFAFLFWWFWFLLFSQISYLRISLLMDHHFWRMVFSPDLISLASLILKAEYLIPILKDLSLT